MPSRRGLLLQGPLIPILAATALAACGSKDHEVGAVEALMREHGVLERAILVFRESAERLRQGQTVDANALQQTARLFRDFGQDYHERRLEETYVFPAVRKGGGPAAAYIDTLVQQHNRGREIIDSVMGITAKNRILPVEAPGLADALDHFALMYANHGAREDTIVFPAWKASLGPRAANEMSDTFADIEKQQFGDNGFDQAVRQIADIEQTLGFDNLAQFTAPPLKG